MPQAEARPDTAATVRNHLDRIQRHEFSTKREAMLRAAGVE